MIFSFFPTIPLPNANQGKGDTKGMAKIKIIKNDLTVPNPDFNVRTEGQNFHESRIRDSR